jgi:hypothetical protein
MQVRITKTLRGALLPAVAALSLFATIPAAQAQLADRQATTAQVDNAQNWGAADGTVSGAYAEFVGPHAHFRRYR